MITWNTLASFNDLGGYVSPFKIAGVVALLFGWAAAAQWVDRDTNVVKTKREQWNIIILAGGLVGFFALFIVPWRGSLFAIGIGAWALIAGAALLLYVLHRNGRVVPAARVLTVDHAKRLMSRGGEDKKASADKDLRVKITDHEGKFVSAPSDSDELRGFKVAQTFLHDLLWRRASDVDMVAGKEKYRVVYRIDGVGREDSDGMPIEDGLALFAFLKRVAGLNPEEIRRPQSGRIKIALLSQSDDSGYAEVQTSGTTAGERMKLHIQSGPTLRRLHELGLAPSRVEGFKKNVLAKRTGLFIISSTPQNGLTTTQYGIIKSHDAYMNNIHALERRSLIELDNITQQVFSGSNTDLNFARTLQSVLRREPDIVMIGDCADRETAQIATRAAAEDRKIYLGLQAKDSFDALAQYLSYVEDNKLAAQALLGVICQRLVRILCTECREAFKPDEATLKKLNLPADKIERFYRSPTEPKLDRKGREIVCQNCQGSGYLGRTGVFELLLVDEAISALIAEGAPINRIRAAARKKKMYYLQEAGLLKVIDGTTSMNEVLRCIKADGK